MGMFSPRVHWMFRTEQGNRIWISQAQIAGSEGDLGRKVRIGDAQSRPLEGYVRSNSRRRKMKTGRLELFKQLGCQENSKCDCPAGPNVQMRYRTPG